MEEDRDIEEVEDTEYYSSSGNLMETKTSRLDDVLNEKLENAFHKQSFQIIIQDIAKISIEHSPIDLAHAASRLPANARVVIYENLPNFDAKVSFMINLDDSSCAIVLRAINYNEIKCLVEAMPLDEAAWMLDEVSSRRLRNVFELLDVEKARAIRELQKLDRNTAARFMTNEFFCFSMEMSIGEASQFIRDNPGIDLTRRIFVTNASGELQGYVPARNLIVNPPGLPLRQVMQPVLNKVSPDATREEVVDLVERYKISTLPVVDQNDFLAGVITYEDIVEAMEDIADETIARMAGTTESDTPHDPVWKRFMSRSPWLLVTLCAGMVNVANMSYFENVEGSWFVFVFFFVPLITGMSGNVGLQCSTILVRSMATGELSQGGKRRAVTKELMTGVLIGIAFGLGSGVLIYLMDLIGIHETGLAAIPVAIIVASGLFGACITATTLGVVSPLTFAKIGVDPAVSSGPVITAFNDVLSTIMYFLIAKFLSSILFSF